MLAFIFSYMYTILDISYKFNMNIVSSQKITFIASLVLLATFVLCCGAIWQGIMASHNTHEDTQIMSCGASELGASSIHDHSEMILSSVSGINSSLIFFVLAIVSVLSLYIIIFRASFDTYYYYIRDRYGSFVVFDNIVYLFKSGILHSRAF